VRDRSSIIFPIADGRAFITAYVAGFETECKLALGVNFYQYTKGWHPTATLGVHGAAAAACHLLRLDTRRRATALAITSSLASGIKANFGTMTKPLHVGHCARNGLFAALLAERDFTANAGEFEHNQGFLEVFNGPGTYDAARILAHWGAPFDVVETGIAIKQYPCCGSTHPALDVMLDLVRRHDLREEAVARIECWTHARRLDHTNRPDPQSGLEAKFSVQYCLARALTNRAIRIEHFEGDAFRDPAVRAILPRVHAAAYTITQFPAGNHLGAVQAQCFSQRGFFLREAKKREPFKNLGGLFSGGLFFQARAETWVGLAPVWWTVEGLGSGYLV
jgi:2-methylcitrate dehydratase PrpD